MSDSQEPLELDLNQKRYAPPVEAYPCGTARQMLFDDFLLGLGSSYDQFPHGVRFGIGTVRKHGAPIFEGEQPWEASSAWCSVLREGGTFRMWYNSSHEGHRGSVVSYAESEDGLHFVRSAGGVLERRAARSSVAWPAGRREQLSAALSVLWQAVRSEPTSTIGTRRQKRPRGRMATNGNRGYASN